MSRPARHLELSDKPPCKKYPGKTVQEMIDDPEMRKWIDWMLTKDGFMKTNCKLNGGTTYEYYLSRSSKA